MPRQRDTSPPPSRRSADRDGDRVAFVARLQTILRHWPSADRLARAVGVSPSAFRKWLKGEAEPSRERLVALADAAGVGVAWLAKGEGPEPQLRNIGGTIHTGLAEGAAGLGHGRFVVLPKHVEAAAAGAGTPPPPSLQSEFIAFRHDWIRSALAVEPEHLLLETAVGESMNPTIDDKDLLLIDTSDRQLREFGIYVLEYQSERLVKRVQRKLDGTLVLISDNLIYEAERVPAERAGKVVVIGRVVWRGGRI